MTKPDGGPAFPQHEFAPTGGGGGYWTNVGGMSLRDWFAGQAFAGIMANPQAWLDSDGVLRAEMLAYNKADAMIAAKGVPHDDRG